MNFWVKIFNITRPEDWLGKIIERENNMLLKASITLFDSHGHARATKEFAFEDRDYTDYWDRLDFDPAPCDYGTITKVRVVIGNQERWIDCFTKIPKNDTLYILMYSIPWKEMMIDVRASLLASVTKNFSSLKSLLYERSPLPSSLSLSCRQKAKAENVETQVVPAQNPQLF
jgi:hypothetical protein